MTDWKVHNGGRIPLPKGEKPVVRYNDGTEFPEGILNPWWMKRLLRFPPLPPDRDWETNVYFIG